jgi:hypothetical protein
MSHAMCECSYALGGGYRVHDCDCPAHGPMPRRDGAGGYWCPCYSGRNLECRIHGPLADTR